MLNNFHDFNDSQMLLHNFYGIELITIYTSSQKKYFLVFFFIVAKLHQPLHH